MEQSAFEAVMIGVNVFVFIIALSAAILLMTSVLDMVNFANERAIIGMNGSIAESVGVVEERTYTGAQILTYYRKWKEQIVRCPVCKNEITIDTETCEYCGELVDYTKVKSNYKFNFKVKLEELGDEKSIKRFIEEENLNNYLNHKFILQYKGEENGKQLYVFFKQLGETSES